MDDFVWSIQQSQAGIGSRKEMQEASDRAREVAYDVAALTRQVDRLALASQAMWELIRDRTQLTETDLSEKIMEVDLRDGKADGKLGASVIECPACGRNTNSRRDTCLWCGQPIPRSHVFEG